jgi:hypothetical protein
VRTWIRAHNRRVEWSGRGVRIISCYLPIKCPWLNPIDPWWKILRSLALSGDRA